MINIDYRSSIPIYEQIIMQIRELIFKGLLNAGDKLPSVRELSSLLTINPNTVSKAYKELERQKVIETLRGKGTFVSMNYKPEVQSDMVDSLKDDIKRLVLKAKSIGLSKEQFVDMICDFYTQLDEN